MSTGPVELEQLQWSRTVERSGHLYSLGCHSQAYDQATRVHAVQGGIDTYS